MSSEVDICNLALSHIRAGSINNLNETSPQAQLCKLKYPILRDMLLRTAPWGFARKIKALSLTTDEIFNWAYAYQYPVDCLYINRLILNYQTVSAATGDTFYRTRLGDDPYLPDLDAQVKFQVMNNGSGNKIVVSNDPNLRLDYRSQVTDTTLFDPLFVQTLSYLLAAELAIPVVGAERGQALRKENLQLYSHYLNNAAADDMNEEYIVPIESDFINVRSH